MPCHMPQLQVNIELAYLLPMGQDDGSLFDMFVTPTVFCWFKLLWGVGFHSYQRLGCHDILAVLLHCSHWPQTDAILWWLKEKKSTCTFNTMHPVGTLMQWYTVLYVYIYSACYSNIWRTPTPIQKSILYKYTGLQIHNITYTPIIMYANK